MVVVVVVKLVKEGEGEALVIAVAGGVVVVLEEIVEFVLEVVV